MAGAGSLGREIASALLRPAYVNIQDDNFNFKPAKQALTNFIATHCKTTDTPNPSGNPDDYNMFRVSTEGLCMRVKKNHLIWYIFNINSGDAYVMEAEREFSIAGVSDKVGFSLLIEDIAVMVGNKANLRNGPRSRGIVAKGKDVDTRVREGQTVIVREQMDKFMQGVYWIPQCHQINTNMVEHADLLHLQELFML